MKTPKITKTLFIFLIFFIFIFSGCKSKNFRVVKVMKNRHILDVDMKSSLTLTIPIKKGENAFLFDGIIQNSSNKNLYLIIVKIYFIKDGGRIQEKDSIILYDSEIPLKPGYEATFSKLIHMPLMKWDREFYEVEFTATSTKKPAS